ncbi:MAG: hypothetical protein ACLT9P_00110 [Evtepia gabavorous]
MSRAILPEKQPTPTAPGGGGDLSWGPMPTHLYSYPERSFAMSAPLSLPGLTQFLSRLEDYPRLLEAVDQGKQTIALSGLSAVHRAYLAAALHQSTGRP